MATLEARVLSNPLRVQILGEITTGPVTTAELSRTIGAPIAAISYHASILCAAGCIRAVGDDEGSSADLLYEVGD